MAAQSSFKNMVLCLTLVCLACSAILGYVYTLTYDPILEAADKALKASIGQVLPEGGEISDAKTAELGGVQYEYYESASGSAVVGWAVKSTTIGFGGPLTVMVGVLPDGSIYNTSVLAHSETPGLGAKCSDPAEPFVAQWKGFAAGKKLAVKKDGGDVDAITASTITSRAYTLAVANAVAVVGSFAPLCTASEASEAAVEVEVEAAAESAVDEPAVAAQPAAPVQEPGDLKVRHSSLFTGGNSQNE